VRGSAQEPERTYRIGVLSFLPRTAPHYIAMFDELRRAGFVEGHNLVVAERGWALNAEQFSEIEHAYFLAVEAAFKKWEVIQNVGR
jgi:hypothetical protein